MSIEPGTRPLRCAAHPARPAHDRCPRCHRPRCGADALKYADRCCAACQDESGPRRPPSLLEVVVRSGIACWPVIIAGGWIATQYVYAHIFSLVVPGLVGFTAAMAATAMAGRRDRRALMAAVVVAAAAGVLGTAFGFHLLAGGRQSVLRPWDVVGAPYLCAVLGAAVFPLLFPPAKPSP